MRKVKQKKNEYELNEKQERGEPKIAENFLCKTK